MATLEDKILGNPIENYCSSDEGENDDSGDDEGKSSSQFECASSSTTEESNSTLPKWSGTAENTGPKGVISDWQRFKQLENENREKQEREKLELFKKLSVTAKTTAEDEKAREQEEMDAEFAELMSDDILLQFQKRRMMEMFDKTGKPLTFGKVISLLNGDEFLNAVDKEHKLTTIVIHIFENNVNACKAMNKCLETVAKAYPMVKFCKIIGSVAGMSRHFKSSGVPCLLVYKAGQIIGNFVRISDELGNDFYPSDVESFLTEHGMLLDKSCVPTLAASADDLDDD